MGILTHNLARQLARTVLSEAEDPKSFFRRMSREKEKEMRSAGKEPVTRCEEWPEWDELEEWQQTAAKELETELNSHFNLQQHDADSFSVTTGNDNEYQVFRDEETAERIAEEQVTQDLEDEPGLFNQAWLQGFIDLDNLRQQLHDDVRDDDYWNDRYPGYEEKIAELVEQNRLDEDPLHDSEGNELELTPEIERMVDETWEQMIEETADERLEDPIDYLADFYGREEAVKDAIKIGGINTEAAAESAIATDGWQHFLARYDGNSYDLASGAVYVRNN